MKVSQLLSLFSEFKMGNMASAELGGISQDSRFSGKDWVFVAIRGTSSDGHDYIQQAIKNGAVGLVVEDESKIPKSYNGASVKVQDARLAMARLAGKYYGSPAHNLFCVGVTGTNGKTSICYFVECVLSGFGWKTGVLGTIDHHLGDKVWLSSLTTPDPLTLQKRLSEMKALGGRAAVFEVSSHAIDQQRISGLPFDAAVFTNLTRDHLDYHHTMNQYFLAKQKLFTDHLLRSEKEFKCAVVNTDDPWGKKLQVASGVNRINYGQQNSDLQFEIISESLDGSEYSVVYRGQREKGFLPMLGGFNVYNAVAALGVGLHAGTSLSMGCQSLEAFNGVPGRMQKVENDRGLHIFVDYAHTDDALRSVLSVLKGVMARQKAKGKIICLFGCGGDRDQGKRPLMLRAATELADRVLVTSDNPRMENPEKIILDILSDHKIDSLKYELQKDSLYTVIDRREAIAKVLEMAQSNDVVLIAGRGHEPFQSIQSEKVPFVDSEVVKEILG